MNIDNEHLFAYKVYGLKVLSEIEIPQLIPINKEEHEEFDVLIKLKEMNIKIKSYINKGKMKRYRANKMWFRVDKVGSFYIKRGRKIYIEPDKDADINDIRVFLLGSAFGMLLIQRGVVAIHGGAVCINDKAVIFTGERGSGKSTLTYAFTEKGYKLLSDDVCPINKCEDKFLVEPSYPQRKLCEDDVEKMGYDIEEFNLEYGQIKKYFMKVPYIFNYENKQLNAMFHIVKDDVDEVSITELSGIDKFKVIKNNIYRGEILRHLEDNISFSNKCLDMANNIKVYRLVRPRDKFTVYEQVQKIKELII